jgi:hypothetical protein
VKVPTPRARRVLVWTVDQSRQFLENARDENDPHYVAYVLMLVLGLRRGEVLGLGWDDVDLDAGNHRLAASASPGTAPAATYQDCCFGLSSAPPTNLCSGARITPRYRTTAAR